METVETSTNGTQAPGTVEMLSAPQARTILDNVEKEYPERWPAAVKTLLIVAFTAIERLNMVVSNLIAAITNVGNDLSAHKTEYAKLVESHKRLAVITIALQNALNLQAPAAAPAPASTGEAPEQAPEQNAAQAAQAQTGEAPGTVIPQDVAEALMDEAVAASSAPPAVASPTAGGKRRGR